MGTFPVINKKKAAVPRPMKTSQYVIPAESTTLSSWRTATPNWCPKPNFFRANNQQSPDCSVCTFMSRNLRVNFLCTFRKYRCLSTTRFMFCGILDFMNYFRNVLSCVTDAFSSRMFWLVTRPVGFSGDDA